VVMSLPQDERRQEWVDIAVQSESATCRTR
jgi:hypothetical protein